MPVLTFTGTTTQRIYNNSTIPLNGPDPNNAYSTTIFNTKTIVWQNPDTVPRQLSNISPVELASSQGGFPIKELTFSPSVSIISGSQQFIPLYSQGEALLGFSTGGPRENKNIQPSFDGQWNYSNINTQFSDIPSNVVGSGANFGLFFNIWYATALGAGPDATNFTMDYILTITVEIDCSGLNLETDVCVKYCTSTDNLKNETCLRDYTEFCFGTFFTPGATGPTIFSNNGENGCYTFFKSYINTGPGPSVDLDNKLTSACSFLKTEDIIPFFQPTGVTGAGPPNIQDICACHLNREFYEKLQEEIRSLPGGSVVDLPDVCLFPVCVNPDSFRTVLPDKTCPVIPCINLADINNNGTIQGGTTINQSCLQSSSSTITEYLIFIIPVGILILVGIIVFLIWIFKYKSK